VAIKFVIDPASGRLIAGVPAAVFFAPELLLYVPEGTEDALQLLVSAEEEDEGPLTDRFTAYHGPSEHVRWAGLMIDSARHGPWVFDGDAMMRSSRLAEAEAGLCKTVNADKGALVRACQRYGGVVAPDPVCVGVDDGGLHVRVRFGIVRVRFERRAKDAADARAMIEAMLKA
jgi:hypothetical protein